MIFMEHIDTLPEQERRLFHRAKFKTRGERALRECLIQSINLKIRADRPLHKEKEASSFGWLLLGNKQKLVEGAGLVGGALPEHLSSTRAELLGIASPNELLHQLMTFHKVESRSKVIKAVDNLAAISQVS